MPDIALMSRDGIKLKTKKLFMGKRNELLQANRPSYKNARKRKNRTTLSLVRGGIQLMNRKNVATPNGEFLLPD